MWCPSCGAEYRAGFTHCPDCDVDLIAKPPIEPEAGPVRRATDDLARVGPEPVPIFVGPPLEADMLRSVLEGSGIPCEIWRPGVQEAYAAAFPYRLVVSADDAERATEIVLAARTGDLALDAGEDDGEEELEDEFDADDVPEPTPGAPGGPVAEVRPWWRRSGH